MTKIDEENLVDTFEEHWIDNLSNISSPELRQNWNNNFSAFDEIIYRNRDSKPSKKICCPSPTGSGKTQQAIHKAISLYGYDVNTLIVTMRTEDADLIADQIATSTHEDYAGVYHSKNVSIEGVKNVSKPEDAQCLIITHEMFRRQQSSITEGRDLIIIDEAIDVITHYQIDQDDIEHLLKIIGSKKNLNYKDKDEALLLAEEHIFQDILNLKFKLMKKSDKSFIGTRPGAVTKDLVDLEEIEFSQTKKLLSDASVKPSVILTKRYNDSIDSAVKKKLTDICDNMKYFFSQFEFMTKNGYQVAWSTAKELIPNKSVVVMDATASVNKAYEFYKKYQPDKLEILPSIECRNYSNVTLHTARTATGRSTILATEETAGNKKKLKNSKTLADMVMNDTAPGDDVLIVTFKELEATLLTFISSITDRRIRVDHWGNLTGTNKYNTCNKIFIYGLNHKPKEIHRSLHSLIKSPTEAFKSSAENKTEFNELVRSDIVAEVIQAINRVRCRNVIDDKGNCEPVDVYLTLPAHYGSSQEMMVAIKSEMHNIQEAEWTYAKKDTTTLTRTAYLEAFFVQLDTLLTDKRLEVKLVDVLDALQINKKQWRENIKSKKNFQDVLEASDFIMEMRHSINRKKQRSNTANTPWFFRK